MPFSIAFIVQLVLCKSSSWLSSKPLFFLFVCCSPSLFTSKPFLSISHICHSTPKSFSFEVTFLIQFPTPPLSIFFVCLHCSIPNPHVLLVYFCTFIVQLQTTLLFMQRHCFGCLVLEGPSIFFFFFPRFGFIIRACHLKYWQKFPLSLRSIIIIIHGHYCYICGLHIPLHPNLSPPSFSIIKLFREV